MINNSRYNHSSQRYCNHRAECQPACHLGLRSPRCLPFLSFSCCPWVVLPSVVYGGRCVVIALLVE